MSDNKLIALIVFVCFVTPALPILVLGSWQHALIFLGAQAGIAAMCGLWLLFMFGVRKYFDRLRLTDFQRHKLAEDFVAGVMFSIMGGIAISVLFIM